MFYIFLLIILATVEGLDQQCRKCPKGFQYYKEEQKCLRTITERVNWKKAQETCHVLNSHLVIVHDQATLELLKKVVKPLESSCKSHFPEFWTSGARVCTHGKFAWTPRPGVQLEMKFTNWNTKEPNDAYGTGENCVELFLNENNNLVYNDVPCHYEYCFICEYDLPK